MRLASRNFAGELEGFSMDKRYVRKNGEVVWIELSVSPIRDEDGKLLKSLGLMQDITERRRALTLAREQLERLERDRDRILESAGEGIYHVDEDGLITFANPAAAELLGWPAEALVGKPAHEVLHHTRADGAPLPARALPDPPSRRRALGPARHRRPLLAPRRHELPGPLHERAGAPARRGRRGGRVHRRQRARAHGGRAARRARAGGARAAGGGRGRARALGARAARRDAAGAGRACTCCCPRASAPRTADDMRGRMRLAQEQIESELDKLRGLISDLRPAALDELGLEASVRDLAERTQVVYGIEVETDADAAPARGRARPARVRGRDRRLPDHPGVPLATPPATADASRVAVELAEADGSLHVRVRDDGRGFDVGDETGSGFGLRGMRERVDLLDGRLAIASSGEGTEVTALAAARAGLSARSARRAPRPGRARARSRRGPSGASGRACAGCARGGSPRCAR